MAQDWSLSSPSDKIKDDHTKFVTRDESLKSCFSGTVFPSSDLYTGMLCYRTDQGKLYLLQNKNTENWHCIADLNKNYISKSYADSTYHPKVLAGTSAPSSPDEGQIWVDTSQGTSVWTVKIFKNSSWALFTTVAVLQGPQGLQGEQGIQGIEGEVGDQGPQGPQGTPAPHEWSGTQLRQQNTHGEWGAYVDLKGPQGLAGPTGTCTTCSNCHNCNTCTTCTGNCANR